MQFCGCRLGPGGCAPCARWPAGAGGPESSLIACLLFLQIQASAAPSGSRGLTWKVSPVSVPASSLFVFILGCPSCLLSVHVSTPGRPLPTCPTLAPWGGRGLLRWALGGRGRRPGVSRGAWVRPGPHGRRPGAGRLPRPLGRGVLGNGWGSAQRVSRPPAGLGVRPVSRAGSGQGSDRALLPLRAQARAGTGAHSTLTEPRPRGGGGGLAGPEPLPGDGTARGLAAPAPHSSHPPAPCHEALSLRCWGPSSSPAPSWVGGPGPASTGTAVPL